MTHKDTQTIKSILDAGEIILKSGGEVNRVEDTITRMCLAYGFLRADVFTITSSIVVTVQTTQGEMITQTRRIYGYDTNLQRVHDINQLARQVCASPIPIHCLDEEIRKIKNTPTLSLKKNMMVHALISSVFSFFYGGGLLEGCIGALIGVSLCLLLHYGESVIQNPLLRYFFCSAIGSLGICLFYYAGLDFNREAVALGNIMLLIPGLALTNTIRDMMNGDTVSGLLRMCDSLLRALAIAAGFISIITLTGGILS